MKILILGGDGYLGWPTAMYFANKGHDVTVADNYSRRLIAEATDSDPLFPTPNLTVRAKEFERLFNKTIVVKIGDLSNSEFMFEIVNESMPDVIIHYAEQPSAPYSMMGFSQAQYTLHNNIGVTFNCIWAIQKIVPTCHLVKLGTMGEYGTPNIDIEEGWIDIHHKGRSDKFLYPRAAGSLYHTTKVLDTDLLWFYVRTYNLKVTDLMQGPVYGLMTKEAAASEVLYPNFNYDDLFGTVLNRFLVQAVAGIPLTVYGKGGQTRGYINLIDTLRCVELASENPPKAGELRILNQFTETFSVNELAKKVQSAAKDFGIKTEIQFIENPRKEKEEHYYNPKHSSLSELGLQPTILTHDILIKILEILTIHAEKIQTHKVLPRIIWNK